MLERADAILKLSLALAALILCSGVGFYYGIFLPSEAREAAAKADAEEKAKEKSEKDAAQRQDRAKQAAQSEYENCLSFAQIDYSNRWDSSCKIIHDRIAKLKADCLANGNQMYCNYDIPPEHSCTLPTNTADSYDLGLQQAKQLCLDKLNSIVN